MASPGPQSAVQLLGRERECAVIDRVLADAGCGVGGALVVRGEAGIGKSAMLEYAVQRAVPGMLVLRVGGVEAESDLAFAGLHGLLRQVLVHLRELPQPQSAALAGALGIASSTGSDRLLISVISALLRTEGAEVADIGTGEAAVAVATAFRPTVAIVDVTPADTSGFVIADRLRALPDGPAVVLTSSAGRCRFTSQLDNYRFVAKADLRVQTI